jgi:hypothetical protein
MSSRDSIHQMHTDFTYYDLQSMVAFMTGIVVIIAVHVGAFSDMHMHIMDSENIWHDSGNIWHGSGNIWHGSGNIWHGSRNIWHDSRNI